jgi:cysteinyl-tRNA synthetase
MFILLPIFEGEREKERYHLYMLWSKNVTDVDDKAAARKRHKTKMNNRVYSVHDKELKKDSLSPQEESGLETEWRG